MQHNFMWKCPTCGYEHHDSFGDPAKLGGQLVTRTTRVDTYGNVREEKLTVLSGCVVCLETAARAAQDVSNLLSGRPKARA